MMKESIRQETIADDFLMRIDDYVSSSYRIEECFDKYREELLENVQSVMLYDVEDTLRSEIVKGKDGEICEEKIPTHCLYEIFNYLTTNSDKVKDHLYWGVGRLIEVGDLRDTDCKSTLHDDVRQAFNDLYPNTQCMIDWIQEAVEYARGEHESD